MSVRLSLPLKPLNLLVTESEESETEYLEIGQEYDHIKRTVDVYNAEEPESASPTIHSVRF